MSDTTLTIVTALAAAQILHESLDDLQEYPIYRHSLKKAAKHFEREITVACDKEIGKLWANDEKTIMIIQKGIQGICKELATLDPTRIAVLGELFKEDAIKFVKDEDS